MKKSLIALAALSAFATAAQAQSSVTVYGIVDVNMTSTENSKKADTAMGESGLNTSRLGFRGTEDLGGGLKAEFQLESRLNPTTGALGAGTKTTGTNAAEAQTVPASLIFNREAWVGLSSTKFGAIRIGRSDITSAQSLDSTVGQAGNLTDASDNLGTDVAKVVRYTTPTFAGFSAQVGYANADASSAASSAATATANAVNGETTAGRLTSVYGQYEAGNLGIYAGQVSNKIDNAYDQKETTYGAKYNFGFAAVGAYRSVREAATSAKATSEGDFTQTIFSVSAPVAALGSGVSAHGVYYKNEYDVANTLGDVDGYKLALVKAFSKRTQGYVAYVDQSDNKAGSTAKESKSYLVGVSHAF
jgi:predicted porin